MQTLVIEIFKVSKNLPVVNQIFEKRSNDYNVKTPSQFLRPKVHSVFYGQESISCIGPKIWDMIPFQIKTLPTMSVFKRKAKIGNQ